MKNPLSSSPTSTFYQDIGLRTVLQSGCPKDNASPTPIQRTTFEKRAGAPSCLNHTFWGYGSPVVKVSNHGRHVMSSIPVPLKTRRVGQRYTLNLSRAETSSRWCGVVVRRGGCQLRCRPRHLTMVQNYVVRRQKPSCS
ncbi:uncharacterized protein TNCV_3959611 [Trichonephila clavipes]|nr:uncharacterized protein TNCV_3959611 [Trichonephila clavipes]